MLMISDTIIPKFWYYTVIKNDDKYDLQTLAENIRKVFDGIKYKYELGVDDIDGEFFLKPRNSMIT